MRVYLFLLAAAALLAAPTFAAETPSADGVAISYEVTGEGLPAVVLIHGWSCDRSYWRYQIDDLAKENMVVAIDLAGHGASGSDREDFTMQAFGADVAAVVTLLGLEKVILVGHSMGGTVILEAAAQLPGKVVGLVGIDTLQDVGFGYAPEMVDNFLKPMKEDFPGFTDKFVRSMFPKGADPELVSQVAGDMGSAPLEVAASAMRNLLIVNVKPVLDKLTVPIVCIDSPARPVNHEDWTFYKPGYTVVLMEGVGHFPMLEKPTEFTANLQEVLGGF